LTFYGDHAMFRDIEDPVAHLAALLGAVETGDYLALLAFLPVTPTLERFLKRQQQSLSHTLGCATTIGIGPRFLHSTGQLHKGGANNGVFLQLTAAALEDLDVPGANYTFGTLNLAQAMGDFEVLQTLKRRVLRVHVGTDIESGLVTLESLLDQAMSRIHSR